LSVGEGEGFGWGGGGTPRTPQGATGARETGLSHQTFITVQRFLAGNVDPWNYSL
jgi:hypothetical protein